MRIIADTHTHTIMSGHAHSTLLENLAAAKNKGLRFLATTDHTGLMPGAPNATYFSCMRATMPEKYDDVYLLRGAEVNVLDENGRLDLVDACLKKLDWVIASIHGIVTQPMDERRHTELWLSVAKNPHVDVIGHCGEEQFSFDYERVVKAFAENGKIVEINASSAKSRPSSQKNCFKIARLCKKYGVPLVLSSDAHFAGDVGNVAAAIRLVEEAGIPEELILNADEKRFVAHLQKITNRVFDV